MVSCDSVSLYPYLFRGTIFLKNGSLVMVDPMNAGEIRILDLQTNRTIHYSMTDSLKGINPTLLPFSFYHPSGRYYHYMMENDRLKLTAQSLRFRGEMVNGGVQLNENNYAIIGYFRKLLGLYDKKSKTIDYLGHYPVSVQIPFERNAKERMVHIFQVGKIVYSEKHSKIIYCSRNFAYISCYRFTGRNLKFDWEHHIIPPPEVSIINGSIKLDSISPRGGFLSLVTAGDYIFACYQQTNLTESVPVNTYNILVYNMFGNIIASYPIDYPLFAIAVDLEEKTIYGIYSKDDTVGFAPFLNIVVRFRFE